MGLIAISFLQVGEELLVYLPFATELSPFIKLLPHYPLTIRIEHHITKHNIIPLPLKPYIRNAPQININPIRKQLLPIRHQRRSFATLHNIKLPKIPNNIDSQLTGNIGKIASLYCDLLGRVVEDCVAVESDVVDCFVGDVVR